jgi:hypothetical protein
MITQATQPSRPRKRLPKRFWLGLAWMILGEVLVLRNHRFLGIYFTPFQWTGYLLFADGLIERARGESLMSRSVREFLILAALSVPSWLLFEGINLLLRNWEYLNLPDSLWQRYLGYGWSFATISPGLFVTYQILEAKWPAGEWRHHGRELRGVAFWIPVTVGLACLIVPLLFPSPYMTPLVWISLLLFLDPLNGRLGEPSVWSAFVR